jgi:hypothetical protein
MDIMASDSASSVSVQLSLSRRVRAWLPMLVVAALFVVVPFLTWRGTWFGRRLSDEQITQFLGDHQKPRNIQHALSQLEERIRANDAAAKRWYPQIVALKDHPVSEIRVTAAWVMGQDNTEQSFHQALRALLNDAQPLVRRNAALALVRFHDNQGHAELIAMLQPFIIRAPADGRLIARLRQGDPVLPGSLLARLQRAEGETIEVRSPLPGHIGAILAKADTQVMSGVGLATLSPDKGQVWEALRALYLVGQPDDLAEVERYARGVADMTDRIKQQAEMTAKAIRERQKSSGQ